MDSAETVSALLRRLPLYGVGFVLLLAVRLRPHPNRRVRPPAATFFKAVLVDLLVCVFLLLLAVDDVLTGGSSSSMPPKV